MGFFTGVLHIPAVFAFLAIAGSSSADWVLSSAVHSRGVPWSLLQHDRAIAMVHGRFGFWMNWTGAQKGEGYEYHLLLLAASAFSGDSRRRSSFPRSPVCRPSEQRDQYSDPSAGCLIGET